MATESESSLPLPDEFVKRKVWSHVEIVVLLVLGVLVNFSHHITKSVHKIMDQKLNQGRLQQMEIQN